MRPQSGDAPHGLLGGVCWNLLIPGLNPPLPNDEPARVDALDRDEQASALAEIVKTCQPPFSLAVYGQWGLGKTSLMHLIDNHLASTTDIYPVWFHPWKHQFDEHPVIGLLHAIARDVGIAEQLDVQNWLAAIALAVGEQLPAGRYLPRFGQIKSIHRELEAERYGRRSTQAHLDHLLHAFVSRALTSGRPRAGAAPLSPTEFRDMSPDWSKGLRTLASSEEPSSSRSRVVVFVDDLDRCSPEIALQVLESLKIYLNHERCVFVLALDRAPIEGAIKAGKVSMAGEGSDYLAKMIQFEFYLPPLDQKRSEKFLRNLLDQVLASAGYTTGASVDSRTLDVVVSILSQAEEPNPRELKRLSAALAVHDRLARRTVPDYHLETLALLVLLQHRYQGVWNVVRRDPSRFTELFRQSASAKEDDLRRHVDRYPALLAACEALPGELRSLPIAEYLTLVNVGAPEATIEPPDAPPRDSDHGSDPPQASAVETNVVWRNPGSKTTSVRLTPPTTPPPLEAGR